MSGETGTDEIGGTVGSVVGLVERLVVGLVVLAFTVGWVGFWGAVVRIHYLHYDLLAMFLTAVLGLVPVVGGLVWVVPRFGLGSPTGTSVDGSTTS